MREKYVQKALALILGISLFLTGCQSERGSIEANAGKNESNSSTEKAQIELKVWHAMSGGNGAAFNTIIDDFNKTVGKQYGIKATGVFQGTQIMSKIKAAAVSNNNDNMPDVAQIVGMDIPTAIKIPSVVKAESYINMKESNISKKNFYPSFLRAFTYKDELIGVPMNPSTILLYYNEDLLKKAGIANPPKTIAELADDIKKLSVKKDGKVSRYGLNCAVGRYELVNFLVEQSLSSFVGDNEGGRTNPMTKVTIGEDGTLNKFLTEWEKVVKTDGLKYTANNPTEEFASQANAMAIMSSAKIGAVKKLVGKTFKFNVAYLPKVSEQDSSGASIGGSSLVMFNKGDQKRLSAAWRFIEYATSEEAQIKWSQSTGYLPVNIAVEKSDSMTAFYQKNPQFKVALDQMKSSSPMAQEPFDMVNGKANTIITDAMRSFCKGDSGISDTQAKIVKGYNSAIQDYLSANS